MACAFAPPALDVRPLPGGGWLLRSSRKLGPYPKNLIERLHHWAGLRPDRVFLAERSASGDWKELTYKAAQSLACSISQSLLNRGLTQETAVVILSGNSIDHALLQLGSMQVGIPVVPVSPAYSLFSKDFARLHAIFDRIQPRLVFARDGARFEKALFHFHRKDREIVVSKNVPPDLPATPFSALCQTTPTGAVERHFQETGPDSIAKILFTSGSTGNPKGVINTQQMLCSNQQSIRQVWPFLKARPPVVLDWLPWSHTFGGNQNFNLALELSETEGLSSMGVAP